MGDKPNPVRTSHCKNELQSCESWKTARSKATSRLNTRATLQTRRRNITTR